LAACPFNMTLKMQKQDSASCAGYSTWKCTMSYPEKATKWVMQSSNCKPPCAPVRPIASCKNGMLVVTSCNHSSFNLIDDVENKDLEFYIVRTKNDGTAIVCLEEIPKNKYIAGPFKSYKDAFLYEQKYRVFANKNTNGLPRLISNNFASQLPKLETKNILIEERPKTKTVIESVENTNAEPLAEEVNKKETNIENNNKNIEIEYKNPVDIANESLKDENKIKIVPEDAAISINKDELLNE
jgi:hypothetical protein